MPIFCFIVTQHSLVVPIVTHYYHHGWAIHAVVPVEEDSADDNLEGVHALAVTGGEVAQRFARFVQDNLCEAVSHSRSVRRGVHACIMGIPHARCKPCRVSSCMRVFPGCVWCSDVEHVWLPAANATNTMKCVHASFA